MNGLQEILKNYKEVKKDYKQMAENQKLSEPFSYLDYIYAFTLLENEQKGLELLQKIKERCKKDFDFTIYYLILSKIYLIKSMIPYQDLEINQYFLGKSLYYSNLSLKKVCLEEVLTYFYIPNIFYLCCLDADNLKNNIRQFGKRMRYYNCGLEDLFQAQYYFEIGEVKKAEDFAFKVLEQTQDISYPIINIYFLIIRILLTQDNKVLLDEYRKKLEEIEEKSHFIYLDPIISFIEIYFNTIFKKKNSVLKKEKIFKIKEENSFSFIKEIEFISYGLSLLVEDKIKQLEEHTKKMLSFYQNNKKFYGTIFTRIFNVIVVYRISGIEKGKLEYKKLLKIVEKNNIIMPIVEFSSFFMPVIEKSQQNRLEKEILKQAKQYNKKIINYKKKPVLSKREIEVVSYIAKGYKRKEIADILYVSDNTIKQHISNIYRKLDAKNRAEIIYKGLTIKE